MADIIRNGADGIKRRFIDNGDGTFVEVIATNSLNSSTSTPTTDRELITTVYRAGENFTGASAGDAISQTVVMDVSGTPSVVANIWRNLTTGSDLAVVPNKAQLLSGGTTARQTEYIVITAFSGASVGDVIQEIAWSSGVTGFMGHLYINLNAQSYISTPNFVNLKPAINFQNNISISHTTRTLASGTETGTVPAGARSILFYANGNLSLTVNNAPTAETISGTQKYLLEAPPSGKYVAITWSVTGAIGTKLFITEER